MKYLFYITIIIGLNALSIKGYSQNFNIGALAGVNASQISGDGYAGFNKGGLILGLFSDIDVSQKVNLQFEINYSQKGSRKNPDTENGDTDFFLLRLDYIEVPVMARFKNRRFTYETGLYYGRLVNRFHEDENGEFEIPDGLNTFSNNDVGALIGINFNFSEHIIMNWRFSHSILPVREHDSGASWRFDSGMLHNYLSFTMRYEFLGSNGS